MYNLYTTKRKTEINQYRRILSLFLLVFEGFGIRVLDGIIPSPIIFWTFLLLLLNYRQLLRMPIKTYCMFVGFLGFYIIFNIIKGVPLNPFLFAAWSSSLLVLSNYMTGNADFQEDLYKFTKISVYYDLMHIIAFVTLFPFLTKTTFTMNPSTIGYIFYYNELDGFFGIPRIQGFCWEPSCWNCLLNLNLALVLLLRKPRIEMILAIISIISVLSTTGLATMFAILLLNFFLFSRKTKLSISLLLTVSILLVYPIVKNNIDEKLETGSGATRYGDFYVAEYVISNSPLLGDDIDNITLNRGAMKAKMNNWGLNANQLSLYDNVGMTNAFAGLFVEWGLFIPIFFFILFFYSPLFENKESSFLIMTTLILVLMGTPIARTGFFYMFPLSTILINNSWKRRYQLLSRLSMLR